MKSIYRHTALVALLLISISHGAAFAQSEQQRVALVIGNADYVNFNKLRNPANDARVMADTLRRTGFAVIEQEDVTRRAMIQATRAFINKLSPGGVGLVYFAGHGVQSQGTDYLLPVDSALMVEDDLKYEAIDLQDILNKLADARVRLSVVILDACRDNPFKGFRSAVSGLARIDPPRGTIIAYSTSPGKVAADGDGNNSIYTSVLVRMISQPGLKLTEVFERVTDEVERMTANAQTPWLNSSFRGDFYFIRPASASNAQPLSPNSETAEIVFWKSVVNSTNPSDFEAYIRQYPQGNFVTLARLRIQSLRTVVASLAPAATEPSRTTEFETALRNALTMLSESERIFQARRYVADKSRAIAVAPSLARSWQIKDTTDDATAETRALEQCQVLANEPCMLIALGDRILPKGPNGSWPVRPQARVTYDGEFDPAQVPVDATVRARPPIVGYQDISGPKALAYHPWGRIFLGKSSNLLAAETIALKACNNDPGRKHEDGPCYLYAVDNHVVLPDRRTQ